jgi:hypothetical protein
MEGCPMKKLVDNFSAHLIKLEAGMISPKSKVEIEITEKEIEKYSQYIKVQDVATASEEINQDEVR